MQIKQKAITGKQICFVKLTFLSQDFNHVYTDYILKPALTENEVDTYFDKVTYHMSCEKIERIYL